ncbi:MAG: protein phosphatase [Pseudomonadota bacterium]
MGAVNGHLGTPPTDGAAQNMGGFVIAAVSVGSGILGIAPMPGITGHYDKDLAHLKDWKPAMVVSMTEPQELQDAGVTTLARDLQHSGTRWFHFPVPDFGVGDALQEPDWDVIRDTALSALRGGGRVLIHCKGGRGRSGMAALRLMIASGEGHKPALKRLRAVRPGAVETRAQQRWARAG